jgi:hypothetical protein
MDINFTALNYDKWKGKIKVSNTTVENASDVYFFQDILLQSDGFRDSNKFINLTSNLLDVDLKGDYTLKGIRDVMGYHLQQFVKFGSKTYSPPKEDFNFFVDIKDTRILSDVFIPKLKIQSNSHIEGKYATSNNGLSFKVQSPGFTYANNEFNGVVIDYDASIGDKDVTLNLQGINLSNGIQIDSLALDNELQNDSLFFDFKWLIRDSIGSRTVLHGFAIQQADTSGFQFGVQHSEFNIGNKLFSINDENSILLDSSGVNIQNLVIKGEEERIEVNGNLSKSPYEILRLNLDNFDMYLLNYFVRSDNSNFEGNLHGGIILGEALSEAKFAAKLFVDSLNYNGQLLGDLSFYSDWVFGDENVVIETNLRKGELEVLDLNGTYSAGSNHALDMGLRLNRFNLVPLNPLTRGVAYNLRGSADGQLKISGFLSKPVLVGELALPKVAFTLETLKTDYNLTGRPVVKVLKDRFVFQDLALRDTQYGTKGRLFGEISHNSFSNFDFDLTLVADELLALNTQASTEEFYYGTAFVTGNVEILGPVDNLLIRANVEATRSSNFNLALDAATEVKQSDYVVFVNPNAEDTELEGGKGAEAVKINSGLSLDFNIEVDQSSDVQVILDQQSGTRLTAAGDGAIRLLISPYQDMQMFGTYTLEKGNFLLSLESLIRKEFDVERGGTVVWNGSPTEALLNVSAKYTTRADPGPLVPNYDGGRTLINVLLHLSGQLEDPDVTFNLEAPRANSSTQTFIANRLIEDDKMNQQVFSLLTFDAFVPDQGISGGAIVSNGANGLDFLASQASNWINKLTGDYNVTLNYQNAGTAAQDPTLTTTSQEEVEVGVSKQFFDDRVTVNGRVGVAVGENQRRDQIAGDFEIEYSITEDGKIRTKAFNRSVQDQFSLTEQNYQQGVGLFYKFDFNSWVDLFKKKAEKPQSRKPNLDKPTEAKKEEETVPNGLR